MKNEATAVSENISAEVRMGPGVIMESIRVVVDWTLRRKGGGDTGASSVLCLRFAGCLGGVIVRMIPRSRFLRIDARLRFLGGRADGFPDRSFDERFKKVRVNLACQSRIHVTSTHFLKPLFRSLSPVSLAEWLGLGRSNTNWAWVFSSH